MPVDKAVAVQIPLARMESHLHHVPALKSKFMLMPESGRQVLILSTFQADAIPLLAIPTAIVLMQNTKTMFNETFFIEPFQFHRSKMAKGAHGRPILELR